MAKLKIVLVGAGGMGREWARNLNDLDDDQEVETVAWVDIVPGAAARAIEKLAYSWITPYENLSQALKEKRPDFVVDVSVPEAHHAVTLEALAFGAHVLGEKPMADSMAHAREMVAASERAGKLYMVSQSRRYLRSVVTFRDVVQQQLGPLGILKSDFYLGPHFGGFREQMLNVLLLDMAIHTFDNARQISGKDPVSVYCEEFDPDWSWLKQGASATAIFEMTDGLRYTYCGSWCAEGLDTSWQAEWRACGSSGSATWDGQGNIRLGRITREHPTRDFEQTTVPISQEMFRAGIKGSLEEFLRAIRTGATPQGECHDNIKSLAMVFAAIESSKLGRRVRIEEIL